MKLFHIIALLVTIPASISAQEAPIYDVGGLAIDTVFEWETDRGFEHRTYIGQVDEFGKRLEFFLNTLLPLTENHYLFHSRFPVGAGQTLEIDFITNQRGQLTRALSGENATFTFPHDCSWTTGLCDYLFTLPSGDHTNVSVSSTYSNQGVWIISRTPDTLSGFEFLPRQACVIVDEYGLEIVFYGADFRGNIRWTRRTNGKYADQSAELLELATDACQGGMVNS